MPPCHACCRARLPLPLAIAAHCAVFHILTSPFCLLSRPSELRKDKGDRSAGGVTPGDADYYAAAARGAAPELDPIPEAPRRPAAPLAAPRDGFLAAKALPGERRASYRQRQDDITSAADNDDDALVSARCANTAFPTGSYAAPIGSCHPLPFYCPWLPTIPFYC